MKFEEEIKQSKFEDEWQKALLNIQYTGNWLGDSLMKIAKKYDINDQHYNILRILRGKHPNCMCPGDIKSVLLNKRGDLTRLLDKLTKMELIERNINPENRRMVNVAITPRGLNLLEKMNPEVQDIENLRANISREEANLLSEILDKLRG